MLLSSGRVFSVCLGSQLSSEGGEGRQDLKFHLRIEEDGLGLAKWGKGQRPALMTKQTGEAAGVGLPGEGWAQSPSVSRGT